MRGSLMQWVVAEKSADRSLLEPAIAPLCGGLHQARRSLTSWRKHLKRDAGVQMRAGAACWQQSPVSE